MVNISTKYLCVQICANNEWQEVKEFINNFESGIYYSPFGEYLYFPMNGFQFMENKYSCILFHSGATKTLSAAACQFAINYWNPEILFVLGTAGAISENLKPLDVIIANRTVQYDCISRMGEDSGLFYKDFVVNMHNSWLIDTDFPSDFYQGTIATADQDVDGRVREILKPHNILAADWESGSIAPICKLNNTSCCIIRGISDIPGQKDSKGQFEEFQSNTQSVMKKLITVVLPRILDLYQKSPSTTVF